MRYNDRIATIVCRSMQTPLVDGARQIRYALHMCTVTNNSNVVKEHFHRDAEKISSFIDSTHPKATEIFVNQEFANVR